VDAVGKTSVTLSVKQRIAEGLSRAGTSNTLKVVSYNAILGIISFFTFGAVRQFCVFAIVVLVAHWFLAHTFFMAVLSIDIARLEVRFGFLYINVKVLGTEPYNFTFLSSARRTTAARHQLSAFYFDCSKR
jgi:Sterol-sensing domain of SREBP cleavage-activation